MSTRGFVGYKQNKKIQGWYNHSDSYPTQLGANVFEKCRLHNPEELKRFFNGISFVKDEGAYASHKSVFGLDWGRDCPVLQDGEGFYKNALFCEWSYIFDLDHPSLKVYRGWGKNPDSGKKDWSYRSDMDGETFYMNLVADFYMNMFKNCCPKTMATSLEECVAILKEREKDEGESASICC